MKKHATLITGRLPVMFATLLVSAAAVPDSTAAESIYDLRHTGGLVDCSGGIVVHKIGGWKPRLVLYDPAHADGWGGIQVKDWTDTQTLYNSVSISDWVSLTNVEVEEFRGTTFLQYGMTDGTSPGYNIESENNILPDPIVVTVDEIAAPRKYYYEDEYGDTHDSWFVTSRDAEKYESMLIRVEDVTVGQMGLGKARDNYVLANGDLKCWASDYLNEDRDSEEDYHTLVGTGQHFESVTGILEQYTKLSTGWDYYQLLTTSSADMVVPEPASLSIMLAGSAGLFLGRRRKRKVLT